MTEDRTERRPVVDAVQRMQKVWGYAFKRQVAADADFFADLEGDSMAAATVAYGINIEFGVQVPMVEVFDHPTPVELAAAVVKLLD